MFIKNKYTQYYCIIEHALSRDICDEIFEKHHIIPKSIGGNNKKLRIIDSPTDRIGGKDAPYKTC
jgi:hypothetical protein